MEATAFLALRGSYMHRTRSSSLSPSVTSYLQLRRRPANYVALSLRSSSTVRASGVPPKSPGEPNYELMKEFFRLVTASSLLPESLEVVRELHSLYPIFSKYSFVRNRIIIVVKWLLKLSNIREIKEVPEFSEDARTFLKNIIDHELSERGMSEVMTIEQDLNHERVPINFLKEICKNQDEISKVLQNFQFGCTSKEINNIAYGLMFKDVINNVMIPPVTNLCKALFTMANCKDHISMLSHTHGKSAQPSTLGKELRHFAAKLSCQAQCIKELPIIVQFSGVGGNYVACTYPEINWPCIAQEFVTNSLDLKFNPHIDHLQDYILKLLPTIREFNKILEAFDQKMLSYISDGYFKLKAKEGETESSTMLDEVNYIHEFVNSKNNLAPTIDMLEALENIMLLSERGSMYSFIVHNLEVVFSHSLVAYRQTLKGLRKLQ